MSISPAQLAPLRSFGYTEVESSFLYLVTTHSWYFAVRQFLDFAHAKGGKRNAHLIEKLFSQGHATAQRYRRRSCVYHLHSRALYDAIGKGELRNRRNHQIRHIRARLLALNYILVRPDDDYFDTAEAKRRYFVETLKVPEIIFTQGTDQEEEKSLRTACKRAGSQRIDWHALRHTHGTLLHVKERRSRSHKLNWGILTWQQLWKFTRTPVGAPRETL